MSTIAQKILASHAGLETVQPGKIVKAEIDFAFMPALTAALAFHAMRDMEIEQVFDPEKVTILLDHIAPATNITNATLHKECREISKAQNLKHFYDINSPFPKYTPEFRAEMERHASRIADLKELGR